MSSEPSPVAVFCASAPEDEAWLRRLEIHVSLLIRQGLISFWHDRLLIPGTNWQKEIDSYLETASIILLLVSADFLASDYCWGIEITRALERHAANEARVIPILVRPSGWKETPLAQIQALPTNNRPIALWPNEEQALADVVSAIRRIVTTEYYQQPIQAASSYPLQRMPVRDFSWLPSTLVSIGVFLSGFVVVWLLIQSGKIPQPWAGILIAVFVLFFGIGVLVLVTSRRTFSSDLFKKKLPVGSTSTPSPLPFSPPPRHSTFVAGREIRMEIVEAPRPIEKAISYRNVFLFNEHLLEAKEFFGRKNERITLLDRASKGSSTSIVGPRRIGKTWLLEYLRHVVPDQLGPGYRVGYINATMPRCDTVSGFIRAALESLGLRILPKEASLNLKVLEEAGQMLQEQHIFPILCIDEFEGLSNPVEFDLQFFKGLRAISSEGLVLVTASKQNLLSIVGNNGRTSGFFNIFETCFLKPFSEEDAREFVQVKGDQARFGEQERTLLLKWGQQGEQQWYPLRLQLAGKLLVEDQNAGRSRPEELDYQISFRAMLDEKYRAVVVEA